MLIDKKRQSDILSYINGLLQKGNANGIAYLFGGNSLISQDIITRTTKDVDFFLLNVDASSDIAARIKEDTSKQFKIKIDIGLNGSFDIEVKGFTWVLPANAYKRAVHILKFSNVDIFALHPLDIVALKCDRLNERDQDDIKAIFETIKPQKPDVISIFEEYSRLLKGNPASIDNIRENFYQLALTIYDVTMKK